jgi:hypothetical protein
MHKQNMLPPLYFQHYVAKIQASFAYGDSSCWCCCAGDLLELRAGGGDLLWLRAGGGDRLRVGGDLLKCRTGGGGGGGGGVLL